MDDDGLLPEAFRGNSHESAETWLSYLQRYSAYKQLSTVQTLGLFMILLRDKASDWLANEPETSKDTLEHLIAAFRKRFEDNEVLIYDSARKLFTTKQSADKSVDEFATEVVKLAQKVGHNRNDDITRYAVLSGLRSEIATHVLMGNPTTTDDVIEKARLVEMALDPDSSATRSSSSHCHQDDGRHNANIQQ